MNTTKRIAAAGLVAVVLTLIGVLGVAHAQSAPMTDDQITRIKANCTSAKNTLNQLHASDALLRVNRGQIYESMSTKLMIRFNDRVSSNRLNADDLVTVTQTYTATLTTFRLDYQAYEEQLSKALNIDCSKEPVAFYDAVASSRTKRTQVHTDVVKLHQHIDDYKLTVDSFELAFNAKGTN